MKTISFIALFTLAFFANAQQPDAIIGKWKFQRLADTTSLDSTSKKMAIMMFGEMTFQFAADGTYESVLFKTEQGKYIYDKASGKLVLTPPNGKTSTMKFTTLSPKTALLDIGKKQEMIMERTE
ncbi:MAG: hypothetical protein EAY81_07895 [Bacteroidetes bacterium]|nr:MAG: hypothetical protein EAY81_07895 [Bacteroidota bacterium]